jgi:MraZ protein
MNLMDLMNFTNFSMLIGEYIHTIDPKKRLAVPAKFRKELGSSVVVTRGLDNCLFVYTQTEWMNLAEKLSKLPIGQAETRNFVRLMLAGASEVDLDSLGRILIPDFLKQYAALEKDVIVTGVFNRLEIWSKKNWEEFKEKNEKNTDELAEKLGGLGTF